MKNPGDQNVAFITIVDDVILDRQGSHASAELWTCTAHPRLFGQQIKSSDDVVNESVSGGRAAVLDDLVPDFVEVLLGERGQPIRHLRLLGASPDFRSCGRARSADPNAAVLFANKDASK
jgi:hypothetical protein